MTAYFAFSGAIGILQFRENYNLLRQDSDTLDFDYSFSILEFLWFFVSVAFLYSTDLTLLQMFVPALFIAFNVGGWGYAIKSYGEAERADEDAVIISVGYLRACTVFGVCYSMLSWFVLYQYYDL